MTRFQRELNGDCGAYWQGVAERKLEEMRQHIATDDLRTNIGGGAFWLDSGKYLCRELVEVLELTDFPFSPEETNRAREEQQKLFLERYRENYKGPSEEELMEMRAAFGAGEIIRNVLTGEEIRL